MTCPKATKNIYIDGAKLFKHLIKKNKGNEELQKAYLDSLETLYDNRIANFGKENYVLGLKGSDMIKYSFSDLDRAFAYLKQSVEGQQTKSKLQLYFHTSKQQLKNTKPIALKKQMYWKFMLLYQITWTSILQKNQRVKSSILRLQKCRKIVCAICNM